MSFSEILKDVVTKVDGSTGIFIIASDGIPVEGYIKENTVDESALSAELSAVLKTLHFAVENLQFGNVKEFVISTEKYHIVVRKITSEYYLVLLMNIQGNIGKGRFLLKITAPKIEKEI